MPDAGDTEGCDDGSRVSCGSGVSRGSGALDAMGLGARERGEDISHMAARRRATYEPLETLVAALPDPAPSPGWRQRVLDAIDEPHDEPRPASKLRVQ